MEYRLLGAFEVLDDTGRTVAISGAKARALLVQLLLARGAVVSMDRLIDGLWPLGAPRSAGGTIQAHVSRLRQVLGGGGGRPSPLTSRKPGYALAVGPDELDLDRFERLVAAASGAGAERDWSASVRHYRQALGLWRGSALAEFADEPFAHLEALRLEELRLAVTEARFDAELNLGGSGLLVGELETLVGEHPLRERLAGQLMVALYRSGRQSEALRCYQAVYQRLAEELGVAPGPELRALEDAVLRHDPALQPASTVLPHRASGASGSLVLPLPSGLTRLVQSGPLLGRSEELALLNRTWKQALSDAGPALVAIRGGPGTGKSHLAAAFGTALADDGAIVLAGRALDRQVVPYQPVVEALRDLIAGIDLAQAAALFGTDLAALAPLLPTLNESVGVPAPSPEVDSGGDGSARRYLMFEAVAALLARLGEPAGCLVVLRDLHLADRSTLLLLEHVLRHPRPTRLVVVAEIDDTLAVGNDGLRRLLRRLGEDGALTTVTIGGLSRPALAGIVERVLPGADRLLDALHERTGGNPLYAIELARYVATSPGLDIAELPTPDRLRSVVVERLARLDPELVEVLGAAAVLGSEFDRDVLGRLVGHDAARLDEALERARAAGVLHAVPVDERRLRFTHNSVLDALRDSLDPQVSGALRRRIAHLLVGDGCTDPPQEQWGVLAGHFQAAAEQDARQAVTFFWRAGDHAADRLGFSEAAHYYEAALHALRFLPGDNDAECCALLIRLSTARRALYDRVGNRATLREAADLAVKLGDPTLLAQVAFGVAHMTEYSTNNAAEQELLRRALAGLGAEPTALRAELLAALARAVPAAQPEAARLVTEARQIARRHGAATQLVVGWSAMLPMWGPDGVDQRRGTASELVAQATELGWVDIAIEARAWRAASAEELGDFAAADADLDVLRRFAATSGRPFFRGLTHLRDAARALARGELAAAEGHLEGYADVLDVSDDFFAGYAAQLFTIRREQGRLAEVEPLLASFAADSDIFAWRAALSVTLAELGRTDEATQLLDEVVATGCEPLPRDWLWLSALTHYADAAVAVGHVPAAEVLYRLLLPYRTRVAVLAHGVLLNGSVARSLGGCAALSGARSAAEVHYREAIALESRLGLRPWLARSRAGYETLAARSAGISPPVPRSLR